MAAVSKEQMKPGVLGLWGHITVLGITHNSYETKQNYIQR